MRYALCGSLLVALAPPAAAQIFVPARSAQDQTELNSRLNLLMRAAFRSQTVLDATELPGPATLSSVALRYDGPSWGAAGGTLLTFDVYLAPAATTPASSSAQFALNHSGALTRVVAATNLNFPADQAVEPSAWGGPGGAFALPFLAPFAYSGSGLVVELRGTGNTNSGATAANAHFDAELDPLTGPATGVATYNGTGCQGAALQVSGQLAPGSGVSCHGTGLGAFSLVMNTLGTSRASWLGLPLPFDMGLFSAPGCFVLNDVAIDLRTAADANGTVAPHTAATTWPVPPLSSLNGSRLQFQLWAVTTSLQLRTSNNAEVQLGALRPLVRGYMTHLHHLDAAAPMAAISMPLTPAMRFN